MWGWESEGSTPDGAVNEAVLPEGVGELETSPKGGDEGYDKDNPEDPLSTSKQVHLILIDFSSLNFALDKIQFMRAG